jgi:hypothetical protein
MVRNKQYSLLAKTDGSDATLTRYEGPFDGEELEGSTLSETERAIKEQFEATLMRLAKTRLHSVSEEVRAQVKKRNVLKSIRVRTEPFLLYMPL